MRIRLVSRSFVLAAVLVAAPAQHPQAVTDCSNCHDDPATGRTDMWRIHDHSCWWCHTDYDFTRTILGPIGTWNHECSACHQESIAVTGNLPTPTNGHRCTVCHGQPMSTADPRALHADHAERVDCAVCHGSVPDVGTVIGSGNRQICAVCHVTNTNVGTRTLHLQMTQHGLNCLECHAGERPPVDVVPGPRIGNTTVVCDVCHNGRSPTMFHTRGVELHRRHAGAKLDCGSCHLDANLQGDREAMPPYDDARRALVDRRGTNECTFCHATTPVASTIAVHEHHAAQWCYDCHGNDDLRPLGQQPPVESPRQACALCHVDRVHDAAFPFSVHEHHAEALQCFTCHQGTPPIDDWPQRWRRPPGVLATYGTGCGGDGAPPVLGVSGDPGLGGVVRVSLSGAPASSPVVLLLGLRGQAANLETYGMRGCTLLVDYLASEVAVTAPDGRATFRQPVPALRGLVGLALYFQWFTPDPDANWLGVADSNGGRATVGW